MLCAPSLNVDSPQVAVPLATVWLPDEQASAVTPSLKVTVPPLTVEVLVTVAVNVTVLPVSDGFKFEATAVAVPVAAALVVIARDHAGAPALPSEPLVPSC